MAVMFSFKFANLGQVISNIEERMAALTPLIDNILEQAADDLVQNEQALVPVRTGALQASITKEKTGELMWEVNMELLYYGLYVDQGTRFMSARPFIEPAFQLTQAKLPAFIQMNINGWR